jgi:CRP/FNR family transcriptional regulator
MVKSDGFKIMTPLCGHAAHNSGFRMPGDLVGAFALTGGRYAFIVQALSRSTICRFPLTRLQAAQLRQPGLAQGLLQVIAHQTGQAWRQITRTELLSLAQFGMLIKNMSIHHKKQNLSTTEFELPMPRTDISDFIALAPGIISHLIGSFTEKKILIFGNKTFRLLDHHALEHACEVLN